jgi:hypothetical protein
MMMTAFDNNNPAVWRLGPARYNAIKQLQNFLLEKIFLKIALECYPVCRRCYRCQRLPEPEFEHVEGAQESIPPAYVVGRAGASNKVVVPARQLRIDSLAL